MSGVIPELVRPAGAGKSALWYLEQVGSTNTWAKEQMQQLADLDAVYSTDQVAGRGRLGRTWENARGQGLYYTIAVRRPMVQPAALPLLASVAAARVLKKLYDVDCQIKWPNDLLLNGRKLCGILCEGTSFGIVCGMGINLQQTEEFFRSVQLPYATSIYASAGRLPGPEDARRLALLLADEGFAPLMDAFASQGFAAIREEYRAACINLNRPVWFDQGQGIARDLDEEGRLVVETAAGHTAVFTGEVSVQGIYGQV